MSAIVQPHDRFIRSLLAEPKKAGVLLRFRHFNKETLQEIIHKVRLDEENFMISQFAQEIIQNKGCPEWEFMVIQKGIQQGIQQGEKIGIQAGLYGGKRWFTPQADRASFWCGSRMGSCPYGWSGFENIGWLDG